MLVHFTEIGYARRLRGSKAGESSSNQAYSAYQRVLRTHLSFILLAPSKATFQRTPQPDHGGQSWTQGRPDEEWRERSGDSGGHETRWNEGQWSGLGRFSERGPRNRRRSDRAAGNGPSPVLQPRVGMYTSIFTRCDEFSRSRFRKWTKKASCAGWRRHSRRDHA